MAKGLVPISDIRRIGEERSLPVVVVFAIEPGPGNRYTIATWGKNAKLCRLAAAWGDQLHTAIQRGSIESPAFEPVHLQEKPSSTSQLRCIGPVSPHKERRFGHD